MVLPQKGQQLPRREIVSKPAKGPPPKKDTSMFGERPYLPMSEVNWRLRKASPSVSGFPSVYSERERADIAQDLGRRVGSYLRRTDVPKILKQLEMEKSKAPTIPGKMDIEKEIRFLKRELMGPEK